MAIFGLFGKKRSPAESGRGTGSAHTPSHEYIPTIFNPEAALSEDGFAEFLERRRAYLSLDDQTADLSRNLTPAEIESEYQHFKLTKRADEAPEFLRNKIKELTGYGLPVEREVAVDEWFEQQAIENPHKLHQLFDAIDNAKRIEPELKEAVSGFEYRVKSYFGSKEKYERVKIALDDDETKARKAFLKEVAKKKEMGFFKRIVYVHLYDTKEKMLELIADEMKDSKQNIEKVYKVAREYEGVIDDVGFNKEQFETRALEIIGNINEIRIEALQVALEDLKDRINLSGGVAGLTDLQDSIKKVQERVDELEEDESPEARDLRTNLADLRLKLHNSLETDLVKEIEDYLNERKDVYESRRTGSVEKVDTLIDARKKVKTLIKKYTDAGAGESGLKHKATEIIQTRINDSSINPVEKAILQRILTNL